MNKLIKLGLLATLLVVLLLFTAVLYFMLFFDINNYKQEIITEVKSSTGRTLEFEDLGLEFYPWLGIEINDVMLSNTKEFEQTSFLRADKIALRIKTMPLLLNQHYELDTLQFYGGEINLVVSEKGRTNLSDLTQQTGQQQQKSDITSIGILSLGGVDIRDFHLRLVNQATDQIFTIDNMNVSVEEFSFGQPIAMKADLQATSNKPEITADIKMHGETLYDADAQTYAFDPIDIVATLAGANIPSGNAEVKFNTALLFDFNDHGLSIDMLFDGLGTTVKGLIQAQGVGSEQQKTAVKLSVKGEDLAMLFDVMGNTQIANQLRNLGPQKFDLQSHLDIDKQQDKLILSELKAQLPGANINGQLESEHIGSKAMILNGQLQASGQNLPLLMQVFGQLPIAGLIKLKTYGDKLSAVGNQGFDADIEFDANVATGDINVPNLSLNTLGLSVNGDLKANQIDGKQLGKIKGELSIQGENLSSLLQALEQPYLASMLNTTSVDIAISGDYNELLLNPIQAQATLVVKDNKPAKLVLNANAQINFAKQSVSVSELYLSGLGLNVNANVSATDLTGNPTYSGKLAIAEFDLRQLMQQTQLDILQTRDKAALKKIALQTQFSGSSNSIVFNSLIAMLDDSQLTGDFSVNNFAQPIINSTVSIDSINVDRYLPASAQTEIKDTVKTDSTQPVSPFAIFTRLSVDSKLKIGQLTVLESHLNNVDLGLGINDGLISLDPIIADLYSGKHQGKVTIDARENLARFDADLQLTGVQIEKLIKAHMRSDALKLSGIADMSVQFSASGTEISQFKDSLSGQAKVAIDEVIFDVFGIGKIIHKVKDIIPGINNDSAGQLTATFAVDKGIITNNDLLIMMPSFKINGGVNGRSTILDMRQQSIGYDLTFTVAASNKHTGYVIPIQCLGSWQDIHTICHPDYAAIFLSIGTDILKQELKPIKGLLDKIF